MPRKMVGYEILSSWDDTALENKVVSKMAKGWEPIGGIAYDGARGMFLQAVVLYVEQ